MNKRKGNVVDKLYMEIGLIRKKSKIYSIISYITIKILTI